jgi:hypothetical protein
VTNVVIGAGPYGLSIAANLLRRDLAVRIFGRSMTMWNDYMPKGMLLKSDGFATNFGGLPLTLAKYCHDTGRDYGDVGFRTPIATLIDYGRAIESTYVGIVENSRVVKVARHRAGFRVYLDSGEEVFATRVIVATGLMGFERLPLIPGLPDGMLTHSSAHNDLSRFAGQRVAVIGAGQSAFETAALLHESGAAQVTVLSRRTPFWYDPESEAVPSAWRRLRHPNFGLGPGWRTWLWSEAPRLFHRLPERVRLAKAHSTFGPAGSGWLKHRVHNVPGIDLRVATATRFSTRLWLSDGSSLGVDHIIAATGYKADMRKIDFLAKLLPDLEWVKDGIPTLNHRYETSIPGLHALGYISAVAWGPSMRFIYGSNFAAPYLARHLDRRPTIVQVNRLDSVATSRAS